MLTKSHDAPWRHCAVIGEVNSSPLDKMATILVDDIFKCIFLDENDRIPIQISPKFVPDGPIDNNSSLA